MKSMSANAFLRRLMNTEAGPRPLRNAQGGIDPQTPRDTERSKAADLITLPPEIQGTNCGNCMYYGATGDSRNFGRCQNPRLKGIEINERMCCALWDRTDVKRPWVKEEQRQEPGS